MMTRQFGIERLKTDLLRDCATELKSRTERCVALEADNAILLTRIHILECKLQKAAR